jgi:hypothetical protein
MNTERLALIESKKLDNGPHKSFEQGACIMEMVSYLANEPWSDRPKCACPALTSYAMSLNDTLTDEHRQLLKPFVPLLAGSRSTPEVQLARKKLIRWRNVTVTYPTVIDTLKLPDIAAKLRSFENNEESMKEAADYLGASRETIYRHAYAYADANANANANAYANAYAYADANANANANAYANAYAYAYAYADADAKKAEADEWRTAIVGVALETLRLALEVKV